MAQVGYEYELSLTLGKRHHFERTILSPTPMFKGMSVFLDLHGGSVECKVIDVELHLSNNPPKTVTVSITPKKSKSSDFEWKKKSDDELKAAMLKEGWEWT